MTPTATSSRSARYDKFLPDARVAALDSAGSPGITVPEIQNELSTTLGYRDDDPEHPGGRAAHVLRLRCQQPAALHGRSRRVGRGERLRRGRECGDHGALCGPPDARRSTPRARSTLRSTATTPTTGSRATPTMRRNRLRYTVDALGSVSENEYDARGNVVTTVRWATRPALTQYTRKRHRGGAGGAAGCGQRSGHALRLRRRQSPALHHRCHGLGERERLRRGRKRRRDDALRPAPDAALASFTREPRSARRSTRCAATSTTR